MTTLDLRVELMLDDKVLRGGFVGVSILCLLYVAPSYSHCVPLPFLLSSFCPTFGALAQLNNRSTVYHKLEDMTGGGIAYTCTFSVFASCFPQFSVLFLGMRYDVTKIM